MLQNFFINIPSVLTSLQFSEYFILNSFSLSNFLPRPEDLVKWVNAFQKIVPANASAAVPAPIPPRPQVPTPAAAPAPVPASPVPPTATATPTPAQPRPPAPSSPSTPPAPRPSPPNPSASSENAAQNSDSDDDNAKPTYARLPPPPKKAAEEPPSDVTSAAPRPKSTRQMLLEAQALENQVRFVFRSFKLALINSSL